MSDTFIELSKYLLVLIIGIYTLESFIVFKHDNIESKKGIYVRQTLCIFALHFVGFATIALQKKEVDYWFLYAFELILLFSCSIILQTLYPKINKLTINHMIMLLVIGSIILARLSFVKAKKQFIIVVISFIIAMFIPFFIHKLKVLKHFTWLYGAIGIFALGIVLIVGAVTNGSKLTYTIAGFTFQPSEFVKILFVFFLAGMLADQPGLKRVISTSIFSAIHVLILVLSKDLGRDRKSVV